MIPMNHLNAACIIGLLSNWSNHMLHNFFIRCIHPWYGLIAFITVIGFIIARKFLHTTVVYRYSLGNFLKKNNKNSNVHKKILYALRLLTLLVLTLLISRIQIVDYRSK